MLLYDLLKPNKYGTMPMFDIYGVGHIFMEEGVAYLKWNYDKESYIIDPQQTIVQSCRTQNITGSYIETFLNMPATARQGDVELRLVYLKVATTEERLIKEAVAPDDAYYYMSNNVLWNISKPHKILANGTGWDYSGNPVTYYVEDILYRLDLQQELT